MSSRTLAQLSGVVFRTVGAMRSASCKSFELAENSLAIHREFIGVCSHGTTMEQERGGKDNQEEKPPRPYSLRQSWAITIDNCLLISCYFTEAGGRLCLQT